MSLFTDYMTHKRVIWDIGDKKLVAGRFTADYERSSVELEKNPTISALYE